MCEMPNLDEDPDDSIEGPGVAKAWAMKVHIWSRRSTLNVKFLNDIPREWGLNTQNIISWANKWKWNTHTGGFNNIPEFVENKDRGDIRVQFMTGMVLSKLMYAGILSWLVSGRGAKPLSEGTNSPPPPPPPQAPP